MQTTRWLFLVLGVLLAPVLLHAAPWEDHMRVARERLLAADVQGALDAAQKAHQAAPQERLPLVLQAAIHDHRKDQRPAREVYKKLKALPPAAPAPEEPPVVDPLVKPGAVAFVGGARINVRANADPKAKPVVLLPINVPVKVVEAQGEWVRIQRHEPEEMDDTTGALLASIPTWTEGFTKASLLSSKRLEVNAAMTMATKLESSGDLQGALRLLSRAMVAAPDAETVWLPLLRVAVATDSFGTALEVISRMSHGPGGKIAPGEAFGGEGQKTYPDRECGKAAAILRARYGEPKVTNEEHGGEGFTHHTWRSSVATLVFACSGDQSNSMWVERLGEKKTGSKQSVDGSTPVFSPDEKRMAFVRGIGLWVLDFTDEGKMGKPRQLVTPGFQPVWSPDGSRILYVGYHGGGSPRGIYVVKADGAQRNLVVDVPGPDGLAWLDNGARIAWYKDGVRWESNADGSNAKDLGKFPPPCPVVKGRTLVQASEGCALKQGKKTWPLEAAGIPSPDGRWWYFRVMDEESSATSLRRRDLDDPSKVEVVLAPFDNQDSCTWDISFTLGLVASDVGIGESDVTIVPLPLQFR